MSFRSGYPGFACVTLLMASLPAVAGAASTRAEHSEAALISSQESAAPGSTLRVALRLVHDDGWHSYWINPGDSGLATRLRWDLPEGWKAGDIEWPAPHRFELDGIHNFGYDGEVDLPMTLRLPANALPGDKVNLQADVRWLVCKDICVSEKASLALPMTVGAPAPIDGERWEAIEASLPRPVLIDKGSVRATDDDFIFQLDGLPDELAAGTRIDIFPRTIQWLSHQSLSAVIDEQRRLIFSVGRNDYFTRWPDKPVLLLKADIAMRPAFELTLDLPPPELAGDAR